MAKVLVVDEENTYRENIQSCLIQNGFDVQTACNGAECIRISQTFLPDVLIAKWKLNDDLVAGELLSSILCVSPGTRGILVPELDEETIAYPECLRFDAILYKPFPLVQLVEAVRHTLERTVGESNPTRQETANREAAIVHVIDDEPEIRKLLEMILSQANLAVVSRASPSEFLAAYDDGGRNPRCLLLDFRMPEMSGLDLLHNLRDSGAIIPVILLTGYAETDITVDAMRHGALDVMEKPVAPTRLLARIEEALRLDARHRAERARRDGLLAMLHDLTNRQRQVFDLLVAANNAKQIAAHLGITFKTVSKHRAAVFKRLGVRNEVELMRLVSSAGQ